MQPVKTLEITDMRFSIKIRN